MKGSRILAETLEDVGVEYVFGLAGSAILGSLDAINQSDIEFVTTRHEQVATTMAHGYALASQRPTGTIAHVGPGAANQILGTACAYRDNVPVITISGNEPSHRLTRDVRHEWDVDSIFENFTKYNIQVNRHNAAQQIRDAVLRSVHGVPGPVHIDFPRDLEEEELPGPDEQDRELLRERDFEASTVRAHPEPELVEQTVDLLREAEQPLVIAGNEIRWFDAADPLEQFVDAAEVPVASTKNARGALPESNPFSLGPVGRPGMEPSNEYLRSADLVLAVGSRFSDVTTNNWELINEDASIVHASLRDREFDRQYVSDVNVFADVGSFLEAMTDAVADEGISFREPAAEARAAWEDARERFYNPSIEPAEEGVDPRKIVTAIDDRVEEYAYTTGGGVHIHFPRRILVEDLDGHIPSGDFGGMGQGFPLAMGAQLALDRPVFCFEGDGGFTMVLQDLETAVREDIPVKIIILNNESFMSQRARQKKYYGERYTGSVFTNPNFGAIAEEFGAQGEQITTDEEISDAVDRLVAADGPALLEAKIDPWLDTGSYDRD